MSQVQGSVLAVATVAQGSHAVAWVGHELSVVNAADFSRGGGTFKIEGDPGVYQYTDVAEGASDGDPDVVVTAGFEGVTILPGEELRVDIWPPTVDTFAEVALPEDRDAALQVEVPHALKPLLSNGVRNEDERESVLMEMRGLSWVLTDVLGYDTPNLADVESEAGEALTVAGSASADAGQAVIDAADAAAAAGGASGVMYGTAATPPETRRNGSPLQKGDLYYQMVVGSSRIAAIKIRSATGTWDSHQLVADSVLVPSSVGDILLDKGQIFADVKLSAPQIETSTDPAKGIKMIGDRLTGYGPTGQLQIDIGGPEGLIKGVTLEGVSVNGGSFKTNAGTDGYVDIRSYGTSHSVKAVGTAGRTAFLLSGVTGPQEYGIMQLFSDIQGRELYATAYMLAFRDSNGTGQSTLEIQNNAIGPSIRSQKKPLYLRSDHGIYINGKRLDDAPDRLDALESSSPQIQRGTGTMNIGASSAPGQLVGRIIVTYPNAFTGGGVPVVMPVARDASTILDKVGLHVESVTNTNFTVRAASTTVHSAISGVTIDWIAIK